LAAFAECTATSFTIGANTLDTNEWALLDGLDQDVKTTDYVQFGRVSAPLLAKNNRAAEPDDLGNNQVQVGFGEWDNANNGSPYTDYIHFNGWSDASGGNQNLLMLNKTAIGARLYQGSFGSGTDYSTYKDFVMTGSAGSGYFPVYDTVSNGVTTANSDLYYDGADYYLEAGDVYVEAGDVFVDGILDSDGTGTGASGNQMAGDLTIAKGLNVGTTGANTGEIKASGNLYIIGAPGWAYLSGTGGSSTAGITFQTSSADRMRVFWDNTNGELKLWNPSDKGLSINYYTGQGVWNGLLVKLYNGCDLSLYSDAGTTRKCLIDGATGNIETKGNIYSESFIEADGYISAALGFAPPTLADASASNNRIYYSSDQSKLVYKDGSGTVHDLY